MRLKFVAVALATLVFSAGWFFLGFKPSSARLTEVKADIETTRTEIAALQARLARLQELKRNEAQLRADAERYAKGLPVKPAVSDFIRQVQNAANDAGIDFLTIAPTTPAAATGAAGAAPAPAPAPAAPADPSGAPPAATAAAYNSIDVAMTANGTFFDIERFVSNMEDLERAIRIQSFNMSGGGTGGDPPLSLSVTLKMFMAAAPAAAPTAPAAGATAPAASPAPSS